MDTSQINFANPKIKFAEDKNLPTLRDMWHEIFGDNSDFIDIYFNGLIKHNQTLIWEEGGEIAAMLYMWNYQFSYDGTAIPCYYLAGLGTLPKYRKRGIMSQLIKESNRVMKYRKIPISILVPAEKSLFDYYAQFGYVKVFEKGEFIQDIYNDLLSLETIEERFERFNSIFNSQRFIMLKTFDDFKRIWRDLELSSNRGRTNLGGMLRIDDKGSVLKVFARSNQEFYAKIRITDIQKNQSDIFEIKNGNVKCIKHNSLTDNQNTENELYTVSMSELTKLLFMGGEIENALMQKLQFPKIESVLNFMLE